MADKTLNPKIWGPHYWFMLHTMALTYPKRPNSVIKKKYYDFIQNLPLFIPTPDIGNAFISLLDKYPVTPYLDTRESFQKWMHFIHNKVRVQTGAPPISMEEAKQEYENAYKPLDVTTYNEISTKQTKIGIAVAIALVLISYWSHYKL